MKRVLLVLFILSIAIVTFACQKTTEKNSGDKITGEVIFENITSNESNPVETENINSESEQINEKVAKIIEGTEGDLIELKPKAIDPDGSEIKFTFSKPFNKEGLWQTQEGDAGKHLVTITADDGIDKTTQNVLVVIKPANKAPTVECPEKITLKEGENVSINCNIFDVDGPDSEISVDYSGWMTMPFYQTSYDDAGEHTVLVRATDKYGKSSTKTVIVDITNSNRPPVFDAKVIDKKVMEEELITLNIKASDPDNDNLTITYSQPFNNKGIWQTKLGDAGTYNAWVSVSDGQDTIKQDFRVIVELKNTAPVIKQIPDILVNEGEIVKIKVDATDREGDPLIITYSGWMNSSEKQTTYEDAYPNGCNERGCTAKYNVIVTVSDGILSTSQDIRIYVKDKNRPPVFTP
ncbi:MAG: hypothetical protein QXG00_02945 [Candidatus Woesearchaeota archaeon]